MAFTFIRLDWPNVIRLLSYDSAPAFRVCWCWHGDYTNREPRQLNLTMWMNFSNSRYIPFTEEVLFSSSYLPEFLKLFNGVCTLHAFFFLLCRSISFLVFIGSIFYFLFSAFCRKGQVDGWWPTNGKWQWDFQPCLLLRLHRASCIARSPTSYRPPKLSEFHACLRLSHSMHRMLLEKPPDFINR